MIDDIFITESDWHIKKTGSTSTSYLSFALPDILMILVIDKNFNLFNQDNYDSFIDSIKRNRSTFFDALFGDGSNVIFYGSYTRSIVSDSGMRIFFRFQRVLDKVTGLTHALIPSWIVPYSLLPLPFQLLVVSASHCDLPDLCSLFNLDPNTLLHIRNNFHSFWRSLFDWLSLPLSALSHKAFQLTGKQFMQMRGSVYLSPPT